MKEQNYFHNYDSLTVQFHFPNTSTGKIKYEEQNQFLNPEK